MGRVLGFEGQFIGTTEDLERLLSRDQLDVFMLSRVVTVSTTELG
ncbi:hypothetical protein [Natrialba sp. PRR66]|nr:hypothetical protein [Natrialba sp. PRR66]